MLAQKGACTYEHKAQVAMRYGPVGAVKFVIVYDDVPDRKRLITMFPGDGRQINVGLQFISYASGIGKKIVFMHNSSSLLCPLLIILVLCTLSRYS